MKRGLLAAPFVFLLASAAWLRLHWDQIPATFPIHWGIHGEANGWSERTLIGVFQPLLIGAVVSLFLVLGAIGKVEVRSMLTATAGIIGITFSMEQRAKMQGLFSGVWGVSSLIGPLAVACSGRD